jgi:hypothetical protein
VRHRQIHRERRRGDRGVAGDRGEIERHQPTTQAGGIRLPGEEIGSMTVAERPDTILVKGVVLFRRQNNGIRKSGAARCQEQESRERFTCLHCLAAEL